MRIIPLSQFDLPSVVVSHNCTETLSVVNMITKGGYFTRKEEHDGFERIEKGC